jgi:hypothetical protein
VFAGRSPRPPAGLGPPLPGGLAPTDGGAERIPRRLLPEAEEGTEGTGGLAAFFLGDPQGGGNIKVAG